MLATFVGARAVARRSVASVAGLVPEPALLIDNQLVHCDQTLPVLAPHTGRQFASIPNASAIHVDQAVQAARRCFESDWSAPASAPERAGQLQRLAGLLETRSDDLSRLESMDCGKPVGESQGDIQMCVDVLRYYAELAPGYMVPVPIEVPDADYQARAVREPRGVAGLITPWNYPLMQAVLKLAPALAAGCSTVLKPAPSASLSCLLFGQMAVEAGLPPGALNVVTGGPPDGEAGAALGGHPGLDLLSFTGSGATGSRLLEQGAALLRPSSLELGGKGSAIVFDLEHMESTVDWIMCGIFMCAGQARRPGPGWS